MNKSLPNIPKSSKHSITSHKSMIAIRVAERFEPQKIKFLGKKDVSIDSLSISKISDVYLSDNSCYDFFDNHVEEKKLEKKPERNNNVLERNGRNIRGFVSLNRKEATPMFVKNPCFENSSRISLSKKLNN